MRHGERSASQRRRWGSLLPISVKISTTPSPVFADVKKSFGYRSRGGGGTYEFEGDTPSSGVVAVVVPACPRMKRLGVMVGAEEMDEEEEVRDDDKRPVPKSLNNRVGMHRQNPGLLRQLKPQANVRQRSDAPNQVHGPNGLRLRLVNTDCQLHT